MRVPLPTCWLLGAAFVLASAARADPAPGNQGLVVRDATLGAGRGQVVPPGPDPLDPTRTASYLVTPDLGEQRGGNLYHSFREFGVGPGETATFTGPDTVDNILTRVTGGNVSSIDGTLRTTIPGADLYLMNPSGILFGAGSRLDVQGSFHATTADYLASGEGRAERWWARPSSSDVLSVAPPAAFGFLEPDATPARVEIRSGSGRTGEAAHGFAGLRVPAGETLAFVGQTPPGREDPSDPSRFGGVWIGGGVYDSDGMQATGAGLWAPSGRIDLVGVGSAGEVPVSEGGSHDLGALAGFETLGTVFGGDGTSLSVSPDGAGPAGNVSIRAGEIRFVMYGEISAVHADEGDAGAIRLEARDRVHLARTRIVSRTEGAGAGADIEIAASAVELHALSRAISESTPEATGAAGSIRVTASDSVQLAVTADPPVVFEDDPGPEDGDRYATGIFSKVAGSGGGGDLEVRVTNPEGTGRLELAGWREAAESGTAIQAKAAGEGSGGSIAIEADRVELRNAAAIRSFVKSTGAGGSVSVTAHEGIALTGHRGAVEPSEITSLAESPDSVRTGGAGGSISIATPRLVLEDGASITATSRFLGGASGGIDVAADVVQVGPGSEISSITQSAEPAGDVSLRATGLVDLDGDPAGVAEDLRNPLTGISSRSESFLAGDAASLRIEAGELRVRNAATVTTGTLGTGDGGDLTIVAERVEVSGGGTIDSSSVSFGHGGDVFVSAGDEVLVTGTDGEGHASQIGSIAFSYGDAGDVHLEAPLVVVEQGGSIATASIGFGRGPVGVAGFRFPLAALVTVYFPELPNLLDREGEAGTISLRGDRLEVTSGGVVDTSSFGAGAAGRIDVSMRRAILVSGAGSGLFSRPGAEGPGGSITLEAHEVGVRDGGRVSIESGDDALDARFLGIVDRPLEEVERDVSDQLGFAVEFPDPDDPTVLDQLTDSRPPREGATGDLTVDAHDVRLRHGALSAAASDTSGGNVILAVPGALELEDGEITASVTQGFDGGNVCIPSCGGSPVAADAQPGFVVLDDRSRILTEAERGHGGDIEISTRLLLASTGSAISAASESGIDGTVSVRSPGADVVQGLAPLAATFLDAAGLLREPCAARAAQAGSFVSRGRSGLPPAPDGWLVGLNAWDAGPVGVAATRPAPALAAVLDPSPCGAD
jgi:filamentous hemagglutinin family protein